jgi:hypothetical protein
MTQNDYFKEIVYSGNWHVVIFFGASHKEKLNVKSQASREKTEI